MDFPIFIGNGPCCWICDNPHYYFVEIWPTFDEEIVKAFQDNVLTGFIFNQFEWAGSHNVFCVARMSFRILTIPVDVFWNDSHQLARHRQHQSRVWFAEIQHRCMFVWCIHRGDWGKHGFERVMRLDCLN